MEVKGFEIEGLVKVDNARVYGLDESIIASGYPMQTYTVDLDELEILDEEVITKKDLKRAKHLGNAVAGSGHDCFLKGIIVQFDLQVPEYIWRQLDRYHFIDYISSQSKMHRILKIDIDKACNKYVLGDTVDTLKDFVEVYNNFDEWKVKFIEHGYIDKLNFRNNEKMELTKENIFNMIIANVPSGLMLTARMTTNYLQLKSIINQRSNHKMQEWKYLCDWFKTLPMFKELVCKE
ncbi:MAG: hypothetical protein J6D47_10220 [Peptostreptococcaceae bacterium]|nr:hypothetical protein [Peptostreptococcaceae bacterium]